MDDAGGGGSGGVPSACDIPCMACGSTLSTAAKFCGECGAPVARAGRSAEYKQVTILFADVVQSMSIAVAVGAERLREIMAELADRCAAVVQRYGGTVDKFTGDGIMAVFGAPAALEDHAVRACLAALGVQAEAGALAADVRDRDGIDLRLRVGLNSGQVIAGEIGSGPFGYTAVGEQVGMAQRMESVAPPGEVMLSASTAQLVADTVALGDLEMVTIKGAEQPVLARRLLGMTSSRERTPLAQSTLVGRELELQTMTGLLERAMSGRGAVVGLVGPPGVGKSRLLREIAAIAQSRGVSVFSGYCESHANQVPFYAVAQMLRGWYGVAGLDDADARARLRARRPDIDHDDLLLIDDLLGIADPNTTLPTIDPDARRRRLAGLINAANLSRSRPAMYILEDVHWIDEASESMMAEVLAVIGQTCTLSVTTYRPEYQGALTRVHGAHTIALAPLTDSEISSLLGELLGCDPSVGDVAATVASRVGGNPFFAEEMVRELAQSGQLDGQRGGYVCQTDIAEVTVPGTVQATIAARIDRLEPAAKRTLSAAAVIGLRFTTDLLTKLNVDAALQELVDVELIDQVRFTGEPEYAFHHPLIRTVAYESQLRSDRADLHRRVAALIQEHDGQAVDENAALIAEHLLAAGDPRGAYEWHMRAGAWSANRVVSAAMVNWQRARQIADSLPSVDRDRTAMRIAPRTLMCLNAFRVDMDRDEVSFDELRELCNSAGDKASLTIAMAGTVGGHMIYGRVREASLLESEVMALAEGIGDPGLIIGTSMASLAIKVVTAEMAEVLRISQRVIDLAAGDPNRGDFIGLGSPLTATLTSRGLARIWLGLPGWREDFEQSVAMRESAGPLGRSIAAYWMYGVPTVHGVMVTNDSVIREIADALQIAERCADDIALGVARMTMAHVLMQQSPSDRNHGLELLNQVGDMCRQGRYYRSELPIIWMYTAQERAIRGEHQESLALMRTAIDELFITGQLSHCLLATHMLVEALTRDGGDVAEAESAVERLAAAPADDGLVVRDIWLLRLRALLADMRGDNAEYRDYRDRYRDMARSLGFEGHMRWAEAMA
jgi:adenylate cyclase